MENSTQIQFLATFGQDGPVGIIDVDTNTQFPINFAIRDVKEPFSRKGAKSYKFSVIGSKETNQLLNHYYDINIVDGTFNSNHKQKVAILRNGVIFLDNAYMQLLGIKKQTNNDVYSDQSISYDIEVGDDVTSFFTDITNKYLSDINFSDLTHTYEATEVVASYSNSAIRDNVLLTGGYKYCLAWTPLTKYKLEECRPAISVYEYWNRIHQAAGYQWSWNNFDSDKIRMDRLWIPYNGDQPKMHNQLDYEVAAEITTPYTLTESSYPGIGHITSILKTQFIADTEILDLLGAYNPVTGEYTSPINTGTSAVDVTFKVDYSFSVDNTSGGTAYLTTPSGLPTANKQWKYRSFCDIKNQTTGIFSTQATFKTDILLTTPSAAYTLAPGSTVISSGVIQTGTIPVTGVSLFDVLTSFVGMTGTADVGMVFRDAISGGAPIHIVPYLTINSIEMIIIPRVDAYGFGALLEMNDFVPAKIKQSDFIKAIANMYNLVMTPDPSNDRTIIYTLRDDYYDAGTEKNWTSKFVTDKESTISFISSTNAKKVILSYKQDTDIVNKDYLSETKEIYGQQEYTLQNENIKGIETKEIIFSPTPMDNTSFGTVNPMWNGMTPKCNIRILLDGGEQPTGMSGAQTYDIVDYNAAGVDYGVTGIATYPMLTHQDNPLNPQFDINFGLCDKYYHDFNSVTNNNLFSMFWRRTIGQIDKGKLFTAYFYLTEYDVSILKLNDKIFVKDTWYNINSLQYDPNSFGPTKVVLMTIDDELAITVLKPRPGLPLLGDLTVATLSDQIYSNLNWNYGDSSVLVLGTGNIVAGDIKNVLIVGNNQMPEKSNTIYSENIVTDNLVVQGFDVSFGNPITIGWRIGSPGIDSVVIGGSEATGLEASGQNSFATGDNSIASGAFAVVMGQDSTASGDHSFSTGNTSVASGERSFASGAYSTAPHYGEQSRASFFFVVAADAQFGSVSYGYKTTNAAATELFLDSITGTKRFTIPFNSMYAVEIRCIAVNTATGDSAMWTAKGIIKNVAGVVGLVAAIVPVQDQADAAMVATVLGIAAVGNYLELKGTGILATNILWNATLNYTKIAI